MDWIVDDPKRNIEDAYVPYGSKEIVILEVNQARIKPSILDPLTGKEKDLSSKMGTLIPLAPFSEDEWIGLIYSSNQPDEIIRFSIANQKLIIKSISKIWDQTSLSQADFIAGGRLSLGKC